MKIALSYIAIALSFIGYIPYIIHIFKGKTKPHAFSWLIWGVLTIIVFIIQLQNSGGMASWVAGTTGIISLFIFFISIKKGEKSIKPFDWLSLILAFVIIFFWIFAKNPLLSVILVSCIDVIGFLPTFRKSYLKPFEETLSTQVISTIKHGLTIFALSELSLVTSFYPIVLFISTLAFSIMLLIRRSVVGK